MISYGEFSNRCQYSFRSSAGKRVVLSGVGVFAVHGLAPEATAGRKGNTSPNSRSSSSSPRQSVVSRWHSPHGLIPLRRGIRQMTSLLTPSPLGCASYL